MSISLPAVYYGIGILNGSLQGQTELSFRPYLLLRPTYWKVFIQMGLNVIGTIATAGAILGFFLTDRSFVRFIIVGLLTGYVVFGLVFNYHIITHDYYHIQAFALVTIGLAACAQHLIQALQRSAPQFWLAPIAAIILLSVYTGTTEARETLYQQNFEDPRIATEIGELIHHSSRTVYVASHYGLPLIYYGEFSGADWRVRIEDPLYRPTGEKERSVEERLSHLGFEPEYFVITNFNLMERKHADLQAYLDKNCRILVEREQFLIYNSCT